MVDRGFGEIQVVMILDRRIREGNVVYGNIVNPPGKEFAAPFSAARAGSPGEGGGGGDRRQGNFAACRIRSRQ